MIRHIAVYLVDNSGRLPFDRKGNVHVQSTKPRQAAAAQVLFVNGAAITATAVTLADLLAELGYGQQRVATARNGEFVAERARAETTLVVDDRIEIVAPRQGG
jgi:sulfur carrier protein